MIVLELQNLIKLGPVQVSMFMFRYFKSDIWEVVHNLYKLMCNIKMCQTNFKIFSQMWIYFKPLQFNNYIFYRTNNSMCLNYQFK